MINEKNKKKLIILGIIVLIFIIFILYAFVFYKKEEKEPEEIPIGQHGSADKGDKQINTYISINEREVDLKAASVELTYILKNPKAKLSSFGEYYIYDGYYVFPQRKIKIKKSFDQILNLVFFNDYKNEILEGVNVTTSNINITSKLGTANYNENGIIIYKTKQYYIIFDTNLKQVSVQFRTSPDFEIFWSLYDMYLSSNDLKRFISSLTKYYPSYTKYAYDVDGLELIYADFGIRLYFKQFDLDNGIYIYSNYDNNGKAEYSVDNLKKKPNVYFKNLNLIVKEEIERSLYEKQKQDFKVPEKIYSDNPIYKNINVLKSYANKKIEQETKKEYKELKDLQNYKIYYENDNSRYTFSNVSIISKNSNNHYNINTAKVADNLLLTEEYLFFSIKNEGIFRLNINTGKVVEIYIGEGSFELKYIKNNNIYYDDKYIRAI